MPVSMRPIQHLIRPTFKPEAFQDDREGSNSESWSTRDVAGPETRVVATMEGRSLSVIAKFFEKNR